MLMLAGVPARSAAASARTRCADDILEGGYEYSELASKTRRGGCVLVFFPIFLAPAGLFSVDLAPLHLLVTHSLGLAPFRPRFCRRRSIRWRSGIPPAAAGRPLLRSGGGHLLEVWCGCGWWWWWLVVIVVVGCGWMRLDVVGCRWMWLDVVVGWQMSLPWEAFGLFGVTRPLPSLDGTYLPDVRI